MQSIILNKNKESLWQDAQKLLTILSDKLESDGNFLINLTYNEAAPFAEFAKSVITLTKKENFEVALLLGYIADYYNGIGNYSLSLFYHEKASLI